ncbi:MAG: response regulator [Candidatus Omnitrophota bacterium]
MDLEFLFMVNKKRVLVIDDDLTVLRLLEKKLPEAGPYEIITASTGRGGLAEAIHSKPDVILLDVMIPDKNGGEIAHLLSMREETKGIPIIFISVLLEAGGHKRIEFNDHEYRAVPKPLYLPELLAQIRKVVNEHLKT